MRLWELGVAQKQIIKIRASLNDPVNPPDKIKRPRYPCGRLLEQKVFDNRVAKLDRLEKHVENMLYEDLNKWFKSVY